MLGFSAKTIRRDIASMPDDVRKMSLACPSDVPVMSLTEYGLKWLAEKHGVPFSGSMLGFRIGPRRSIASKRCDLLPTEQNF